MTSKRNFTMFAVLAALAGALPSNALAGPLLSGYGGPGQGNQAVLGSVLLGGPGGGGSGSGGSGSGGSGTTGGQSYGAAGEAGGIVATPSTGSGGPGRGVRSSGSARRAGAGAGSSARSSQPAGIPSPSRFRGYTTAQRAAVSEPLLGLSGLDVVYIVLVLGVLAFTGVLTGRLARAHRSTAVRGSRGAA